MQRGTPARDSVDLLERALELHRARDVARAHGLYRKILAADPCHPDALHLAGVSAHQLGDFSGGVRWVERAIAIRSNVALYHQNLGLMHLELGDCRRASASFQEVFRIHVQSGQGDRPDTGHSTIGKLRHDAEQLRYLQSRGLGPADIGQIAERHEAVLEALGNPDDGSRVFELDPAVRERLGSGYNQPLHIADAPAVAGSPLGPGLDAGRLVRAYRFADSPVASADEFLTAEALQSLRRFCLESTLWFEFRRGGYLGSRLDCGFNCPLLLQIAIELRQRLPELLAPHPLHQIWAFKYDAGTPGIPPHADEAAVNVNFWLTDDEASLDPQRGGLTLYDVEAPADWSFSRFNGEPDRVRRYLRDRGAGQRRIPHRQNRMVLFKSRLFHETDSVPFRPGYTNRRINVTILYGKG